MNLESLKLEDLDRLTISIGSHPAPNGKVEACAMEAGFLRWAMRQGWDKSRIVSEWSDSMPCTCPLIGGFVRRWNDGISDDSVRTRLFSPEVLDMLPGTKGSDALMLRRMWMAIDWDIRTRTPAFLRLANLETCAVALESLPEIVSHAGLTNARVACEEARKQVDAAGVAAWAAAGAAARDAARDAAGDAARAAARAAAWDAAWDAAVAAARDAARDAAGASAGDAAGAAAGTAAWNAAWDAAWAAARNAARDAAGVAARDAAMARLRPTVEAMQVSAIDLLKRMCEAK
jgi:hypothetical protein